MTTKSDPKIIEPGYAITNECIRDLTVYYLGYINYGTPQETKCAVKINDLDKEENQVSAQREKEVLQKVNHRNIAQTYKIIEKDNKMYIFKEYEEQITLKSIFQRLMKATINEMDILNLAVQLIHCLNYMESLSLTNRDLNPANILYNREKVYKIFDFGSSRVLDDNQIMQSMAVGGNEFFMSPQMLGIDEIAEIDYYKSDIWSLGMILYYFGENTYPWRKQIQEHQLDEEIEKMATRKLQFQRTRSIQLQNLIARMLTYDQDERASASQLLEDPLIQNEISRLNPQLRKLEFLTDQFQKLMALKNQQELDETYEETVFNHLLRFFTQNKGLVREQSQIYPSYQHLLDYQMFNKKELFQNFKLRYKTNMLLKNFVNEYKKQSTLTDRQNQELMILLKVIECEQIQFNTLQELIKYTETKYLNV